MTIWVNCIVNNEENFIWFALMSVVDYADKVLVWDSGSTDRTVEIIKEIIKIKGDKIEFKEVGSVDKYGFTKLRQAQLTQSKCDWVLILDGDEIWWETSIKKLIKKINTDGDIEGIAVPMIVPVGDIYHFQGQEAGKYSIHGKTGHISLKAINRNIRGLHVDMPYGKEGYFDENNQLIQERENIIFSKAPFLHLTHLKRSSKARKHNKFKIEIGESSPPDFKYPEVLYKPHPKICPDPWQKMSGLELAAAQIITPVKRIKRKFL